MCCADVMLSSFASGNWVDPVCGSLLWHGLDGSTANTAALAYAAWLRAGGKFITTGIDKSFGPERIAEFVALKRESQRLLGALEHRRRCGKTEHGQAVADKSNLLARADKTVAAGR
jgi:hypothetical protein